MAKATVITNAMRINTGRAPSDYGKAVRVDIYFDANTIKIPILLSDVMQNGNFNNIQSVFVDNSYNSSPISITFPGISQRLVVNAFTQTCEPVYLSDTAASAPIECKSSNINIAGHPVSIWFSNVPQPYYVKSNLVNRIFNLDYTLAFGNTGAGFYSYNVDTGPQMTTADVSAWDTIVVDNSIGFQSIVVTDITTGDVIYTVQPYSVASFPTLGLGSTQFNFALYDPAHGTYISYTNYVYNVNISFKSGYNFTYEQKNVLAENGLYSISYTHAFAAYEIFTLQTNSARSVVGVNGTSPWTVNNDYGIFLYQTLIIYPTALFGTWRASIDRKVSSSLINNIFVYNNITAQTLTIVERF